MSLPVKTSAAVVALLVLAGCGSSSTDTAAGTSTPAHGSAPAAAASAEPSRDPAAVKGFLSAHGLAGMGAAQIVEKLDRSADDREAGPMGSVRPSELVLSDKATGEKVAMAMPSDRFYLAMAPYTSQTHECFNHNTASCQGEIVGETVHVKLVADGKTVVDKDVTTQQNGFAALWVPRNLQGTLTVSHQGKSVEVPVSTADDAPTCITTPLKLA